MKTGKAIIIFLVAVMLVLAATTRADAQHYIGIRGGYGGAMGGRFYPKPTETATQWGMASGGVSWKFFTHERFAGGVEVDLLYMQQGFKYYSQALAGNHGIPAEDAEGAYYARTVNSIMLPIFWQPHAYFARQKLRVFLNAGVTFSFNMSSKEEYGSDESGATEKNDYKFKPQRDNRWGYGLCAGAGAGWAIGNFEVVAEARYYIGYSDILKNRNKYEPNFYQRTPMDQIQLSVGLYYRLGKEGIRAPMTARVEQKWLEWERRKEAERREKEGIREGRRPLSENEAPIDSSEWAEVGTDGATGNGGQ